MSLIRLTVAVLMLAMFTGLASAGPLRDRLSARGNSCTAGSCSGSPVAAAPVAEAATGSCSSARVGRPHPVRLIVRVIRLVIHR